MHWYFDSSALLKTVLRESETDELIAVMGMFQELGDTFATSALSQVEVSRAIRRAGLAEEPSYQQALKGMDCFDISAAVIEEAKSIGTAGLRSLDAIHLATARLTKADAVVTYDERMIQACMDSGVATARPGVGNIKLPEGWHWAADDLPDVEDCPIDWTDWA